MEIKSLTSNARLLVESTGPEPDELMSKAVDLELVDVFSIVVTDEPVAPARPSSVTYLFSQSKMDAPAFAPLMLIDVTPI